LFTNRSRNHDIQGLVTRHFSAQTLERDERLVCESPACQVGFFSSKEKVLTSVKSGWDQGARRVHLQQTKVGFY